MHLKTPRISLVCKLVPLQYRDYEYGILTYSSMRKTYTNKWIKGESF